MEKDITKDKKDMIRNEKQYSNKTFEDIRHIDEYGNEYWYAREL